MNQGGLHCSYRGGTLGRVAATSTDSQARDGRDKRIPECLTAGGNEMGAYGKKLSRRIQSKNVSKNWELVREGNPRQRPREKDIGRGLAK